MKKALITGITGQDGSYLAEMLLDHGDYEVHGIVRRSSSNPLERLKGFSRHPGLHLHHGDLTDATSLLSISREVMPDEIYNLGAQSHVKVSFDQPVYTVDAVGLGAMRMLECAREIQKEKPVRFYQASSSEMFGSSPAPQNEETPFCPRSPYACAKLYAHNQVVNYREAYGLYACSGILFNHESPRRSENFVTRKITRIATRIKLGLEKELVLGNLEAKRDWGYSKDYVLAMWLMLQQKSPGDYVIATGETHTVQEFLTEVFEILNLDQAEHVRTDPKYMRPAEVNVLCGDADLAKRALGWMPTITFKQLVRLMVSADLELAEQEKRMQS